MFASAGEAYHHPERRARDWVVLGLCTLVGGLAGLGFFLVKAPVYTAQTTVLVLPTAGGLDSTVTAASDIQIETEAEIANSAQTAAAAAAEMEGRVSAETLREGSDVTVTPNSQVLTVTFKAADPALARDGAQALSQAYLTERGNAAKATVKSAIDTLTAKQKALLEQQAKESAALNALDSSSDNAGARATHQANLSLINAQLADVNGRLVALQVQSTQGGQIISAATLPTAPTSPVLWIDVAAGLAVGALVGSGLMLLMQRRREHAPVAVPVAAVPMGTAAVATPPVTPPPTTSSSPSKAAPARAATPEAKPAKAGAASQPVVASTPTTARGPAIEAASGLQVLASVDLGEHGVVSDADHRALRALCRAVGEGTDRPGPVVLVGVDYHVLMTEAAFALHDAWIAEFGRNALVLADAETPSVPARPALDGRGLTDVLSGEWGVLDTVTVAEDGSGALLGPGLDATELPSATQRHRLQNLWRDLEGAYGSTTVEVQVPFEGSLAQNIVQTAGPLVVVVKGGLSQQQDLAYAIEQLTWLGLSTHVVGIVAVTGRSRTGSSPSVDLTPAKVEPKADAKGESRAQPQPKTAASTSAARQTGGTAEGMARPGAGRARS